MVQPVTDPLWIPASAVRNGEVGIVAFDSSPWGSQEYPAGEGAFSVKIRRYYHGWVRGQHRR